MLGIFKRHSYGKTNSVIIIDYKNSGHRSSLKKAQVILDGQYIVSVQK
jgi:hypothetical protein